MLEKSYRNYIIYTQVRLDRQNIFTFEGISEY